MSRRLFFTATFVSWQTASESATALMLRQFRLAKLENPSTTSTLLRSNLSFPQPTYIRIHTSNSTLRTPNFDMLQRATRDLKNESKALERTFFGARPRARPRRSLLSNAVVRQVHDSCVDHPIRDNCSAGTKQDRVASFWCVRGAFANSNRATACDANCSIRRDVER